MIALRSVLRQQQRTCGFMQGSHMRRLYSSATQDEYQSLGALYAPVHKVEFQGNTAVVFDSTETKEKRFVPYEIKETTFKNGMGFVGVSMFGYCLPIGDVFSIWAAGFALNWVYRTYSYMAFTVRKIELN